MLQFFTTVMGKQFFESSVPRIAKALERIANALELLEKQEKRKKKTGGKVSSDIGDELIIPLENGGTLRCGHGDTYAWGGYVRICDAFGNEKNFWHVTEWMQKGEGEAVIGAIFTIATRENL